MEYQKPFVFLDWRGKYSSEVKDLCQQGRRTTCSVSTQCRMGTELCEVHPHGTGAGIKLGTQEERLREVCLHGPGGGESSSAPGKEDRMKSVNMKPRWEENSAPGKEDCVKPIQMEPGWDLSSAPGKEVGMKSVNMKPRWESNSALGKCETIMTSSWFQAISVKPSDGSISPSLLCVLRTEDTPHLPTPSESPPADLFILDKIISLFWAIWSYELRPLGLLMDGLSPAPQLHLPLAVKLIAGSDIQNTIHFCEINVLYISKWLQFKSS